MIDIIAELGSNPVDYKWNTLPFCQVAADSGATHVKIQIYKAEHFPEPYQAEKRRLEFPRKRIGEFAVNAHRFGLKAGASVFDAEAVDICARELDFLKLAAREQHNHRLIDPVYTKRMMTYRSISHYDPYLNANDAPFIHLWAIQNYPAGMGKSLITLLQAWKYFKRLRISWGWSSHTTGAFDCILAARLGASVIEKHLALSHSDVEGGHSLLPEQFAAMVRGIRRVER